MESIRKRLATHKETLITFLTLHNVENSSAVLEVVSVLNTYDPALSPTNGLPGAVGNVGRIATDMRDSMERQFDDLKISQQESERRIIREIENSAPIAKHQPGHRTRGYLIQRLEGIVPTTPHNFQTPRFLEAYLHGQDQNIGHKSSITALSRTAISRDVVAAATEGRKFRRPHC